MGETRIIDFVVLKPMVGLWGMLPDAIGPFTEVITTCLDVVGLELKLVGTGLPLCVVDDRVDRSFSVVSA